MATNLWCAFCLQPPNCPSNAKKFKKLYGGKSEDKKKVLSWLFSSRGEMSFLNHTEHLNTRFSSTGIPFSVFKSDAHVCVFCQRLLKSIDRLQQDLYTSLVKAESIIQQLSIACEFKLCICFC